MKSKTSLFKKIVTILIAVIMVCAMAFPTFANGDLSNWDTAPTVPELSVYREDNFIYLDLISTDTMDLGFQGHLLIDGEDSHTNTVFGDPYTYEDQGGEVTSPVGLGVSYAKRLSIIGKFDLQKGDVLVRFKFPIIGEIEKNTDYAFSFVFELAFDMDLDDYPWCEDTLTVIYREDDDSLISYILGDVNGDGEVTADDLTVLARHVAMIETITDENLLKAADVTGDGDVTADDMTKIAKFVAKIIATLE